MARTLPKSGALEHSALTEPAVDVEALDLVARDGTVLGATLFTPRNAGSDARGAPRGTVIIHAATATPQGYYRRFALFAAQAIGARVLTYDYRGIGRSRPRSLRGFSASLSDWARLDATAAHDWVRERFPAEPVALIGHSFGGQLVGMIDEARAASGMVMVGAQLAYYRDWPREQQARLAFTWRALVPGVGKLLGYVPGKLGLGEDLPRGVGEQWARWCLHPDYLISEHPDARERFARFDAPTLFYSFTDDEFAPTNAVDHLLRRLHSAPLQHARIAPEELGGAPIGHFGFFRPRFAPTLWNDAAAFLRDSLAGRKQSARGLREIKAKSWDEEIMEDLAYGRD
jgi:predicted alpha/beta hydrolase